VKLKLGVFLSTSSSTISPVAASKVIPSLQVQTPGEIRFDRWLSFSHHEIQEWGHGSKAVFLE
jgi:hypothetical protein